MSEGQHIREPRTAEELKAIIRNWLDRDSPAHYGSFEKQLAALVDDESQSGVEDD